MVSASGEAGFTVEQTAAAAVESGLAAAKKESHGGDNSFTVEDGGAGLARCGWMMRDLAWSSRILLVRKWLLNVIECFVERTASPFLMMFPSY